MSTCVYEQELDHNINTANKLADSLEEAAKILRKTGQVSVYVGGTIYVDIFIQKDNTSPEVSVYV